MRISLQHVSYSYKGKYQTVRAVWENIVYPLTLRKIPRKAAAIARTLAQGCKIILADEPTDNLDSTNTQNIVEILKKLAHDNNCTVIIVTHDPAVAQQADTVLQMKDGSCL